MLHEVKVSYLRLEDDGSQKQHKEWHILEDCNTFTEAEAKAFVVLNSNSFEDFDVTDIKRSKIREVANKPSSIDDRAFVTEVRDLFVAEDGAKTEMKYSMLLFARNFDDAKKFISEYLRQGYNLELVGLKESRIVDVY